MKLKIDAKTIAGLELPKGRNEDFVWDEALEGFGLRLRRSGDGLRRTYVVQYRIGARRSRRITVGPAERFTPAQAREAARKILARVSLGHDPQGERREQREQSALTFAGVVTDYLADRQPELRPASYKVATLYLTGAYFKPLHHMPLGTIKRSDVATCIRAIVRNHSASTASAARNNLSPFFAWAISQGLLGDGANPVDGAARPTTPAPRDRVLSNDELVAIWRACDEDDFGKIVRLLILLGSRRREIGGVRWSEIDLTTGTWTLPKERSKNHHAHTITLPPAALAIIEAVPRTSRDHLFGDHSAAGFNVWDHYKKALDQRLAGTVKPWRLHDLRRTAATRMADIGILPHLIEAALNHQGGSKAGVAGIYKPLPI
jgi:integrase